MPTRVNYESTISPDARSYGTPGAPETLGKRADTGLQTAFIGGFGNGSNPTQQAALENARKVLAGEVKEDFTGPDKNQMFPQYRRNFQPAADSPEYENPRNKPIDLSEEERNELKLGNAYTPTIASPGEGNGIDPTKLKSIPSEATLVLRAGPLNKDNPADASHQNTDKEPSISNIGKVRRFTLGVGSGANAGTSPEAARGQFPRPPT